MGRNAIKWKSLLLQVIWMQCAVEMSFEKARLMDKKAKLLEKLSIENSINKRAWYRMKIENVNKEIREYNRSH